MTDTIQLIAFLGNHGSGYARTRHNAGWLLADSLDVLKDVSWQKKFGGVFCREYFGGGSKVFLKPHTFMNRSGRSVQEAAAYFGIEPAEILVVHDDLELDFGQISFKFGGGLAGHNGLRSVSEQLGTRDFCRFRIGISRPDHGSITPYVLGAFNDRERDLLPLFFDKAAAVFADGIGEGIESAEKKYFKTRLIGQQEL